MAAILILWSGPLKQTRPYHKIIYDEGLYLTLTFWGPSKIFGYGGLVTMVLKSGIFRPASVWDEIDEKRTSSVKYDTL